LIRSIDELLWVLRREGFPVSTARALDALRACELVGFEDRETLRGALAAVIVERAADRARFREVFDRFFTKGRAHAGDFWGRLRERGFSASELEALRELFEAAAQRGGPGDAAGLLALAGTEGDLDQLLAAAGVARALAPMHSPLQVGFYTQAVADRVGVPRIGSALRRLRSALRESLGEDRGSALADALAAELEAMRRRIREHVEAVLTRRIGDPTALDHPARGRMDKPFYALTNHELEEVRRAVRTLAERLRGAERVRRRRALRGRIDPHRTLRRSLRTGGVPFVPAKRVRRRDRPKLMILCDVSDSVRHASRFMLELVSVAQELFARTRSFVFVSELAEVTQLFERATAGGALAKIARGEVVSGAHNSNYGRVLRDFEQRFGRDVDRRTTVVILGDGRTNYFPDEAAVVRRLRERSRALLWLCPEEPSRWGTGDSAMVRYAAAATQVLVTRTARELEAAAREVVARRK
jgi:uncharacterized protein with von Willebrand factor type A (vWA) domain